MLRPQQLRAALHPQPTTVTTPAFLLPSLSQLSLSSRRPQKTPAPAKGAAAGSARASFSTSARRRNANIRTTVVAAAESEPSAPPPPEPLPQVPEPTAFVPDVRTFLLLIGRGMAQHAAKFPSWESLFSLSSEQLRELGVEPPRNRRYLLSWRQRFRRGHFGIGGDLRYVQDGVAELRVLEVEVERKDINHNNNNNNTNNNSEGGSESATAAALQPQLPLPAGATTRKLRFVVNVPPGTESVRDVGLDQLSRVRGYKVKGARTISGPYALPLPLEGEGSAPEGGARITITEGMWESKRGRKIDGGERRRTMVRYKKRIAERRELREKGLL